MKGIIFNVAEEVVSAAHGVEVWEAVLERAGLPGSYTSLGSYPDDDLHRLIAAGSDVLDVPPADVLRAIGFGAMPLLAARYPDFFTGHVTARSFVLTLNDIIHPEVAKLYPGVDVPEFDFDDSDPNDLVITYRSARRLCALAEGFLLGAAAQYGEHARLYQERCMHDGHPSCVIHCAFVAAD
jgi:hypothetical protein